MNVRRFQSADRVRLLEFLERQYPDSPLKANPDYFHWRFATNPLGASLDHYWLAWDKDTIVGQLATLTDRIRVNGQWHDVQWLVDLIVAPEHRDTLTALRLFQAAMQSDRVLLTSGATRSLLPLYESLGWRRLRLCETYYLPIRPGRLLAQAERSQSGRAANVAAPARWAMGLADRILPSVQRLAARDLATLGRFVLERTTVFDSRFETVIDSTNSNLGNTNWRSSEQLDWKFVQRPHGRHEAYLALESGTLPVAYWVFKPMRRLDGASWLDVADYMIAPQDSELFRTMSRMSARIALANGLDAVRLRVSRPEHQAVLNRPLWIHRTEPVSDEIMAWARDARLLEQLNHSPWHLTALAADRIDYGRDEWPDNAAWCE